MLPLDGTGEKTFTFCKICIYNYICKISLCPKIIVCKHLFNVGTYYSAQSIIHTVTPLFAVSDF